MKSRPYVLRGEGISSVREAHHRAFAVPNRRIKEPVVRGERHHRKNGQISSIV